MATINFEKSRKNCLGTMSFVCKFGKMRKEQEFCVYNISNDFDGKLLFQSDSRWAEITLDGHIWISASHSFSNHISLAIDKVKGKAEQDQLTEEQATKMFELIRATSCRNAGTNGLVYCDNSGAKNI